MKKYLNQFSRYFKLHRLLFIFALLFILVRLPFLNQQYLLHDERDISLSGYMIAHYGTDLYGNKLPFHFEKINPDNPLFAIYFSALAWLTGVNLTVANARLPYIILSTLLIFIVYHLINDLTRRPRLALVTALVFCFSPWIFHLTRLAMDIPVAMITIFSAILFQLRLKRFISFVLYFISFYTYQGFRIVIPFLILYIDLFLPYLNLYQRQRLVKPNSKLLIDVVFILLLLVSTQFIDKNTTQSRYQELIFLNQTKLTEVVNFERNTSLAPLVLKEIFSNKVTASIDYFVTTIIKGLDLSYLFKNGDSNAVNGNAVMGQFWLPLSLFFFLGFVAIGKNSRKEDIFLLGLILIGMLPSAVSSVGTTYSIRSMVSAIGFAYLISRGIGFLYPIFIQKIGPAWRYILGIIFILICLSSFFDFIYGYYWRRPITVSELFNEHERQLAYFLKQHPYPVTIFSPNPNELYLSTAFLNNPSRLHTNNPDPSNQTKLILDAQTFVMCPQKIDTKAFFGFLIISTGCLDKDQYAQISMLPKVDSIPYRDFSNSNAYFIINQPLP